MQGQILEFETDRIIDAAQAIGESRGIRQGIEKGRALGIIDLGRLKGASREEIVKDLAGVFNVSIQDASDLYDQLLTEHTKQPNA